MTPASTSSFSPTVRIAYDMVCLRQQSQTLSPTSVGARSSQLRLEHVRAAIQRICDSPCSDRSQRLHLTCSQIVGPQESSVGSKQGLHNHRWDISEPAYQPSWTWALGHTTDEAAADLEFRGFVSARWRSCLLVTQSQRAKCHGCVNYLSRICLQELRRWFTDHLGAGNVNLQLISEL